MTGLTEMQREIVLPKPVLNRLLRLEAVTKDIKAPDVHRKCRAVGLFVLAMLIFRCWEQTVRAGCPSSSVPVYVPKAGESAEVGISTFHVNVRGSLKGTSAPRGTECIGPIRSVCF